MGDKAERLDAPGFQTAKSGLWGRWRTARPILPAGFCPPCRVLHGRTGGHREGGFEAWAERGKGTSVRVRWHLGKPVGSERSLFALQPKNPCCSTRAGSSCCFASHLLPLRQEHMSTDVAFFSLTSTMLSPPPAPSASLLVRLKERSKMV